MTYDMDIDKIINKYKVNDYIFSDKIAEMITSEEKYITILKEMLDSRLCDILEKI